MLDDWMEYGGCDTLDYQALKKALPELLTLLNQKMSLPTLSEKERTAVINSRKSERERNIKGKPQEIIITGTRKKIDLAAIEKLNGRELENKLKEINRE